MQRKCYLLPIKNSHSTAFSYKYLATNSSNLTLSDCMYSPRGPDECNLLKVILMKQNKKEKTLTRMKQSGILLLQKECNNLYNVFIVTVRTGMWLH